MTPFYSFSGSSEVPLSLVTGQRLAAQKGETDDLVGAMKAQEEADNVDDNSDEES